MANCTFDPYIIVNWTDKYTWYYENGSTLYCNQDFNWQCNATFSGDSDIGGYGVMISFVTIAGITTLLAVICAFTPEVTYSDCFRSWWSAELPGQQTFEPDLTKISGPRYWLHEFSRATLPPLCDLQLITGTGIMISGLVHINTISMYHAYLVNSYWYLTFNSLWAAVTFLPTSPARPRSSLNVRTKSMLALRWLLNRTHLQPIFVLINVALAIYAVMSTILREERWWDPLSSGNCYRYDPTPLPINEWVWVAGMFFFEIRMLLSLHPRTDEWTYKFDILLSTTERRLISTCRSLLEDSANIDHLLVLPFRHPYLTYLSQLSLFLLIALITSILWMFRQILCILALGSGTQAVTSFFYVVFYVMNAASTVRAKVVNRPLVEDETSWGFGQILPLILMLSILLLAIDAVDVADEKLHKKRLADMQLGEVSHADDGPRPHADGSPVLIQASGTEGSSSVVYARPYLRLPLYRAARDAEMEVNMTALPSSRMK